MICGIVDKIPEKLPLKGNPKKRGQVTYRPTIPHQTFTDIFFQLI